jgi:hypothetical protein
MRCKYLFLTAVGLVLAFAVAATAHHGFNSVFESEAKLMIAGKVSRFDWMNPHPYLYLDVKADGGKVETWAVEFSDTNKLGRVGLTPQSMKVGDEISVLCFAARAGGAFEYLDVASNLPSGHAKTRHFGRARELTLADGKKVIVP